MGTFTKKLVAAAAVVAMSAGAAACSSSGDSEGRNAAVVAGTVCKKAGEYKKVSGQNVVCARGLSGKIWYSVASVKKTKCKSAGQVRNLGAVVQVCGTQKNVRKWMSTKPLPATAAPAESSTFKDALAAPESPQAAEAEVVVTVPAASAPTTAPMTDATSDSAGSPGAAESVTTLPGDSTVPAGPGSTAGATTTTVRPGYENLKQIDGTRLSDLKVASVASGYRSGCALLPDGSVQCFGLNSWGENGDGTTWRNALPVKNLHFDGATHKAVKLASSGWDTYCGLEKDGSVWCWGYGAGLIGNNSALSTAIPRRVTGFDGVARKAAVLEAGEEMVCAIDTTKKLWCWGSARNAYRFGDNNNTGSLVPRQVTGTEANTWVAVSITSFGVCAIDTAGAVWCWGKSSPLLWKDEVSNTMIPPTKMTGTGAGGQIARQIVASMDVTCVMFTGSVVKCWGMNYYGGVGDGTFDSLQPTPVSPTGLNGATSISRIHAGQFGFCAVLVSGQLRCWGSIVINPADSQTITAHVPTVFGGFDGETRSAATMAHGWYVFLVVDPNGRVTSFGYPIFLGEGWIHADEVPS